MAGPDVGRAGLVIRPEGWKTISGTGREQFGPVLHGPISRSEHSQTARSQQVHLFPPSVAEAAHRGLDVRPEESFVPLRGLAGWSTVRGRDFHGFCWFWGRVRVLGGGRRGA
jgi:hypothetical protein